MKKFIRIFSIIIIFVGAGLLCYPALAGIVNHLFANREISSYEKSVNNYQQSEIDQLFQMAEKYNATLPDGFPADPFTSSEIHDFTGTEFENFSMVQQGTMLGYVEVPTADIYLPFYYGTSTEVLNKGAGLVERTSLPIGGMGTHAVISAHTGLASKKLFTDLTEVKEGDIFFIHILNCDLAYKVDQIKVVLPDETDDLRIEQNHDYVTLLTCTPFGINDHRLLVRGERIDYDFSSPAAERTVQTFRANRYFWAMLVGILGIAAFVITGAVRKHKERRNDSQ